MTWRPTAAGLICLCGGGAATSSGHCGWAGPERAGALLARYAGLFDENCYLELRTAHTGGPAVGSRGNGAGAAVWRGSGGRTAGVLPGGERARHAARAGGDRTQLHGRRTGAPRVERQRTRRRSALAWAPKRWRERFEAFPAALEAADGVLERCAPFELQKRPVWPVYALEEGQTAEEALAERSRDGRTAAATAPMPQSSSGWPASLRRSSAVGLRRFF